MRGARRDRRALLSSLRIAFLATGLLAAVIHWWTRLPRRVHQTERSIAGLDATTLEAATKVIATVAAIGVALSSDAAAADRLVAAAALVLCLAGDIALLHMIDRFVLGLGAFLLGHLVLIVLFVRFGVGASTRTGVAVVLGCLLAATAGQRILRGAREQGRALTAPVALYLVTILSMAVVGWSTQRRWVWLGVSAFVVSDAVLGWEQFVERRRWLPVTVMSTYHLAIFALALSV